MIFPEPLQPAILLRRYKRFLADVRLEDGSEITVHCPNSGSMLGCGEPGLEVKNCSLVMNATALFPDAVTERGTRHLRELLALRRAGQAAAIIFCVQREDAEGFTPARDIDPLYAATLAEVVAEGVLALAGRTSISPSAIILDRRLPVVL